MPDHPSALALESLAAGEEMDDARAHLETCDACRAHVDALRAAIEKTPSAEPFLREVAARARPPRRLRRATFVAGALALAAGLLLFVRTQGPDERLKGNITLAVIRERAGAQERCSGTCRVLPGDRLRLELATAEARTLTAGVLSAEGEWFELEPAGPHEPGTHLSRSALKVDDRGLAGRAIVGAPTDVDNARHGRPSAAVAVAIERENAP